MKPLIDHKGLSEALPLVKAVVDREIKTADRHLKGAFDYIKQSTGKLLRPSFVLIGARFGSEPISSEVYDLAAAIEILHTATLIHDDVIDEAKYRRGRLSYHEQFSKAQAIYMGDFLFSRCFMMLTHLQYTEIIGGYLAKGINKMCLGEMKQYEMRFNPNLSPYVYLKIISRKTAALFGLSLMAGAKHLQAEEALLKQLYQIGVDIGMAFQIMDDVLDFEGDAHVVGKDVGVDILRGYYSLPLILALRSADQEAIKAMLQGQGENIDIPLLFKHVVTCGALDEARVLAKRYHDKAKKRIIQLPNGEGKEMLLELLPALLNRNF